MNEDLQTLNNFVTVSKIETNDNFIGNAPPANALLNFWRILFWIPFVPDIIPGTLIDKETESLIEVPYDGILKTEYIKL